MCVGFYVVGVDDDVFDWVDYYVLWFVVMFVVFGVVGWIDYVEFFV